MAKRSAIAYLQMFSFLLLSKMAQSKSVYTNVIMYDHEFLTGAAQNVIPVAGLPNQTWGYDKFGTVFVFDNILTRAFSLKSAVVGRLQGTATVASLENMNIELLQTVLFTSEKYNGSTVELKGVIIQSMKVNELAIVGGTKQFRFATGYATFEPISIGRDAVTIRLTLHIRQGIVDDFPGIAPHLE